MKTEFIGIVDEIINNIKPLSSALFALSLKKDSVVALKINMADKDLVAFFSACLKYLKDKDYSQKEVQPYPIGQPKNTIEAMSSTDKLIADRYKTLFSATEKTEKNQGDLNQYNAYAIKVTLGKRTFLFINKKTPYTTFKTSSIYFWEGGRYVSNENATLLELAYHFDCILAPNFCYLVTLDADKILGLERQSETQKVILVSTLKEAGIITDEEAPGISMAIKGRAALTCNQKILDDFKNITAKNKKRYTEKYGLDFVKNKEGNFVPDLSTKEKRIAFIETITNKRARDFENTPVRSTTPFIPVVPG